jgi:hypothetical protein
MDVRIVVLRDPTTKITPIITLEVVSDDPDSGTADVSPSEIQDTSDVTVRGLNQTKPRHNAKLRLQAKLKSTGKVLAMSPGFSVCAHPLNWKCTFLGDIPGDSDRVHKDPRQAALEKAQRLGLWVKDEWESDSLNVCDLNEVEIIERVRTLHRDNPPFGEEDIHTQPTPNAGSVFTFDKHSVAWTTITKGRAGRFVAQQLCSFTCKRCGATGIVVPCSGYERTHEVFLDPKTNQWMHRTRKVGAAVVIDAFQTGAGKTSPAPITSSDHLIPDA